MIKIDKRSDTLNQKRKYSELGDRINWNSEELVSKSLQDDSIDLMSYHDGRLFELALNTGNPKILDLLLDYYCKQNNITSSEEGQSEESLQAKQILVNFFKDLIDEESVSEEMYDSIKSHLGELRDLEDVENYSNLSERSRSNSQNSQTLSDNENASFSDQELASPHSPKSYMLPTKFNFGLLEVAKLQAQDYQSVAPLNYEVELLNSGSLHYHKISSLEKISDFSPQQSVSGFMRSMPKIDSPHAFTVPIQEMNFRATHEEFLKSVNSLATKHIISNKPTYPKDPVQLAKQADEIERVGHDMRKILDHPQAFSQFEKSLKIREEIDKKFLLSSDFKKVLQKKIALTKSVMGTVQQEMSDFHYMDPEQKNKILQNALKLQSEALHLLKKNESDNQLDIAAVLNNIGNTYSKMKKHTESIERKEEAVKRMESFFKEKGQTLHPLIIVAKNNLANSYIDAKNLNAAIEIWNQCVDGLDELFNKKPDPLYVSCLNNLGTAYLQNGDVKMANHYQLRSLMMQEEMFGGHDHPLLAIINQNIGNTAVQLGKYEEAKKAFEKSMKIHKKFFGDQDHLILAIVHNNLGHVYAQLGDYKKAKELFEKATQIHKNIFGNDVQLFVIKQSLADVHLQLGDKAQAVDIWTNAINDLEEILGKDKAHPLFAIFYNNFGTSLYIKNFLTDSIGYYKQSLKFFKNLSDEANVFTVLNNLANNMNKLEKHKEALEYQKEACELMTQIIEKDNSLKNQELLRVHIQNMTITEQKMQKISEPELAQKNEDAEQIAEYLLQEEQKANNSEQGNMIGEPCPFIEPTD